MKTPFRLALALALVVLLAVAATAIAATTFTSGKYVGTTEQKNSEGKHRKIKFKVNASTGMMHSMRFVETGKCNDDGTSIGTQKRLHAEIDANGDFRIDAPSNSGASHIKVRGHVEGSKATGTFSLKSRFNKKSNKPDPDGSIKCSTGTVEWSAHASG
jgi:hypothetical protein